MADGDNSGGIGGLLGSIDPSLLANLGLGLINSGSKNSELRGNWGAGLQQGLGNYQQQRAMNTQNQMQQMQMKLSKAQFAAEMPMYQALGEKLHQMNQDPTTPTHVQGLFGGPGAGAPPPAAPPIQPPAGAAPAPSPVAPNGTLGPPPQQQQAPAPNRYRPPAPLPSVGGDPLGDVQLGTMFSALPQFKGLGEAITNRPKNLQAAQETLIKQRQMDIAEPMNTLDTVAGAANADSVVKNDPELAARWQEVAPRLGLDPLKGLTPDNARAFARYSYNEMAASAQQPSKPMPDVFDLYPGANGQVLQKNRTTGAVTEPVPQKLPTFTMEKRWNPDTQRNEGIMVQTSPGGSSAPAGVFGGGPGAKANQPNAPRGTAPRSGAPAPGQGGGATGAGGLGAAATAPIDLGYEKPSADNLKAAQFANYARNSNPMLQKLEDSGYRMSPTARSIVIDAAVNDDPGKFSQWMSQEALAHKLSAQDTTYMSALMPLLQAAGHSMSGARLTQSQMRTNFESLIPVSSEDPQYIQNVQGNRNNLYRGLLAQTGPAAQMPEFKSTLGSDRLAISMPKTNAQGWALHKDKAGNLAYVSPDGKQFAEAR